MNKRLLVFLIPFVGWLSLYLIDESSRYGGDFFLVHMVYLGLSLLVALQAFGSRNFIPYYAGANVLIVLLYLAARTSPLTRGWGKDGFVFAFAAGVPMGFGIAVMISGIVSKSSRSKN